MMHLPWSLEEESLLESPSNNRNEASAPNDCAYRKYNRSHEEIGLLRRASRACRKDMPFSSPSHPGKKDLAQATGIMQATNESWESPTDPLKSSTSRRIRVPRRNNTNIGVRQRTASPDQQPQVASRPPPDILFLPNMTTDVAGVRGTAYQSADPPKKMAPITQSISYPAPDIISRNTAPDPGLEVSFLVSALAVEDSTNSTNTTGNKMMEEMDMAVIGLRNQLVQEKRLLFLQENKIDRIENQILNVEVEYITLRDTTSSTATAKASAGQRRREKIESLREQIGALQTELAEEEAALELEETFRITASQQEQSFSSESRLGKMKEKRDHLLILRETMRGEASDIARAVTNTEAELKSLCAIARMVQREEI